MTCLQYFALAIAASLAPGPGNANGDAALPAAFVSSAWAGSWEISEEANRLLGFADDASRADSVVDQPSSFHLKLDKTLGQTTGARMLKEVRELVFRKINHEVIATGKWETQFSVDPGIGSECFVTKHEGQTYLWVLAPFTVLYGGKITILTGADHEHDLLVMDFNTITSERTPDTFVYRRKAEEPEMQNKRAESNG